MARVLVVDDEEGIRSFLCEALEGAGHHLSSAADGEEAWGALEQQSFAVVISDLKMPRMDGLSLLRKIKAAQPEVEVVLLTAHGSVENAVEAMKEGAFDYLRKPVENLAEVRLLVDRAAERHRLRSREEGRQRATETIRLSFGAPSMKPVEEAVRKVAATDATVLLTGESGTGKEVTARAIHQGSARRDGPFVAVNCAALSQNLLESELFGHEKGAFTGASARRRGRIELAAGGTFFLDEIGELAVPLQAKLLRVVQERSFERVGGGQTIHADVRWIAATNRDLRAMVADGGFREDLYHRLAVFPVALPPLRERTEDVGPLAELLLSAIGPALGRSSVHLEQSALEVLARHPWPGNIRELRNALERAVILAEGGELSAGHFELQPPVGVEPGDPSLSLAEVEKQTIEAALRNSSGNRKEAAQVLGIGVRTLYEKLRRYDLK